MGLRITTWNVNGIRNPFSYQPWRDKKTFNAMFDLLEADIVILQETKIQRKDLRDDMVLIPGWDCYFSLPSHEKGKFGVVIYTRQQICAPIRAEEGLSGVLCPPNSSTSFRDLPRDQQIGGYPTVSQAEAAPDATALSGDFSTLDCEGRCVILEFPAFVLLGVYNPATRDDSRNAYRIAFLNLLDIRIRNLVALGKRVILAGDLNIIREEIDMANAVVELRKRNLTIDEYFAMPSRRMLNQLVANGYVRGEREEQRSEPVLYDLCRSFHPDRKGMFTCWETKINARPGNFGSRIDYILCSLDMHDWFSDSNIQEGLMGSDHCPVYAVMNDEIPLQGKMMRTKDVTNPPGMFSNGQRLREYSSRDMLPLSGKMLPEFSGRRSIRDMFAKRPSLLATPSTEAAFVTSAEDLNGALGLSQSSDTKEQTLALMPQGFDVHTSSKSSSSRQDTGGSVKGIKRSVSGKTSTAPSKKAKPNSTTSQSQSPAKGQQSLKGFFKPKAPETTTVNQAGCDSLKVDTDKFMLYESVGSQPPQSVHEEEVIAAGSLGPYKDTSEQELAASEDKPYGNETMQPDASHIEQMDALQCASQDTAKSKETWSKLFSKPVAPRCEGHDEPCKSMVTKKPGINCGRSFWMCAKPLGPSGMKENGTEWRCRTFIWCSDWASTGGIKDSS